MAREPKLLDEYVGRELTARLLELPSGAYQLNVYSTVWTRALVQTFSKEAAEVCFRGVIEAAQCDAEWLYPVEEQAA